MEGVISVVEMAVVVLVAVDSVVLAVDSRPGHANEPMGESDSRVLDTTCLAGPVERTEEISVLMRWTVALLLELVILVRKICLS